MHNLCWLIALGGLAILSTKARAQVVPLATSQAAIVGRFANGPYNLPLAVNASQFQSTFGSASAASVPAAAQAREFFANGGSTLYVVRVSDSGALTDALAGQAADLTGLNALSPLSDLRILIAPDLSLAPSASFAAGFAAVRAWCEPRGILFILDPPPGLASPSAMISWVNAAVPSSAPFCAVYFPYLQVTLDGVALTIAASGTMAGTFVKSDASTAIWKNPSGAAYPLTATGLTPALTYDDADRLNTNNVCAIRQFSGTGIIPFGARTLDQINEDAHYIAPKRTQDWVAACIQRSLAFAALRADDSTLWSNIVTSVDNFLQSLFIQGALQGTTSSQAYFARCDSTTTAAADIAAHRVNLLYGVALLRASEFDYAQLTTLTADSTRQPTVPLLRPRLSSGQLYLSYPTAPGFTYHFQTRSNLSTGAWSDSSTTAGDGAWRTPVVNLTGAGAFYRVQIIPGS